MLCTPNLDNKGFFFLKVFWVRWVAPCLVSSGLPPTAMLSWNGSSAIRSKMASPTSGSWSAVSQGPWFSSRGLSSYTKFLHGVSGQQPERVKAEAAKSPEPSLEPVYHHLHCLLWPIKVTRPTQIQRVGNWALPFGSHIAKGIGTGMEP